MTKQHRKGTTHELAKKLLALPDVPLVLVNGMGFSLDCWLSYSSPRVAFLKESVPDKFNASKAFKALNRRKK